MFQVINFYSTLVYIGSHHLFSSFVQIVHFCSRKVLLCKNLKTLVFYPLKKILPILELNFKFSLNVNALKIIIKVISITIEICLVNMLSLKERC